MYNGYTPQQLCLMNQLQQLWAQHVYWTRFFIISTAEELGDLLKVVGLASVYCYDGDDWAGGWNKDYDILVMVGDPSAADNPIYVGAGPEGESK